jgi:hypothetical protein
MVSTIEKLKQQARDSWKGEIGEQRAMNLEDYLKRKLKEYSDTLGIPQEDILKSWEKRRDYSAINYYQECNQPTLNGHNVRVFDTAEELLNSIGEKRFRCPACGGISTNPYECNSGLEMSEGKICDWKVYGLFRDLGKGVFVFCKDKMQGETIFMPIAWEKS